MSSLLFQVKPSDPVAFGVAVSVLAFVALAACYIPARRATRVRPIVTLCRGIPLLVAVIAGSSSLFAQGIFESQGIRYQTEVVATGLQQPSAMVFLPDGRALLVERRSAKVDLLDVKSGAITALEAGFAPLTGKETGAPDATRQSVLTMEDAGLHDIALHPNYANNGWIYISYSLGEPERSTTAVDRCRLRGNRLVDRERILAAEAYSEDRFHYGGRLTFVREYLFVTVGDRHHQNKAQQLSNHAGKILRLYDDGRVPPDNPFFGRADARPEIWSYGHRNPQGLMVHPQTGELWSHEHGPLGGDELNIIRRGANYGWPVISWGWEYSGGPIGMGITAHEGMEQPVWVWTPAIAPSGMFVYIGNAFPAWRGSVFIGSMAQHHLNRLVMQDGRVVVEERLMYGKVGRVRLVAQGPDGFIYIGNDDGQLLRLRPAN